MGKKTQLTHNNIEPAQSNEELHKKLDLLKENVDEMKTELKAIKNQYSLLLEVLGENTVAIKSSIRYQTPKFSKMFPLKTIDDLKKIEELIDETNEQDFSATIRALVVNRGIKKGLADIITPEVLINFNIDGVHNKKRLLNYPELMNILFTGTYEDDTLVKPFKEDLRAVLKLAKNRFFKEKSIKLKKAKQVENLAINKNISNNEQITPEENFQNKVNFLLSEL